MKAPNESGQPKIPHAAIRAHGWESFRRLCVGGRVFGDAGVNRTSAGLDRLCMQRALEVCLRSGASTPQSRARTGQSEERTRVIVGVADRDKH